MARRTVRISAHETFVIPNDLNDEQFAEIKKSFDEIDVNRDGRLSKLELTKASAVLGMNPTEKDINDMMREVDTDNDGFISFKEYVAIMRENFKEVDFERERMLAAFRCIDKDNDGFLTLQELKAVLLHKNKDITNEEIEDFFKYIDKDGDGKIDYQVSKMALGKASGPSGIVTEIRPNGSAGVALTRDLVDVIVRGGCIPTEWEERYIISLYKGKGDALDSCNFRGLKLINQIMGVFERFVEILIRHQIQIDDM